jgi:hypothetical protein
MWFPFDGLDRIFKLRVEGAYFMFHSRAAESPPQMRTLDSAGHNPDTRNVHLWAESKLPRPLAISDGTNDEVSLVQPIIEFCLAWHC